MLEPSPPRRDPRLLFVDISRPTATYVVLDAWEIRSLGTLPREPRSKRLVLWRVFVQGKPSHVLVLRNAKRREDVLLRALRERALRAGLPLATLAEDEARTLARKSPQKEELVQLYPELRQLTHPARAGLLGVVRTALGALLTKALPPRRYVPTLPPHPSPDLAP